MPVTKIVGVKHNPEEAEVLAFVMQEEKRTAAGAYKFAILQRAKELGYKPKTKKKGQPKPALAE